VLHAKTLVADSLVSIVGSSNLVILDDRTGATMARAFRNDLAHATAVDLDAWPRRGRPHRLGDALARFLSPML
jgi:cardiolipin synthase